MHVLCQSLHAQSLNPLSSIESIFYNQPSIGRLYFALERMSLGIQDPLIQANSIRCRVKEIEVLQCFGQPETLHFVRLIGFVGCDVVDGRVAEWSGCMFDDGLEHLPAFVLPGGVACYAVHVPY